MSTNYEITRSDGNLTFTVSPYSANGPENPSSEAFYRGAIKADTSLAILGKGMDDYGERIQENMVHLLEHFSNEHEPSYPSGGQIWCDRSQTPPKLKIYNIKKHINKSSDQNDVVLEGNHIVRFGGIDPLSTVRIFSNIDYHKEDYKIIAVIYESLLKKTRITISSPKGVRNGWYVGGWDDFIIFSSSGELDSNGFVINEIDAYNSIIKNVADADISNGNHAVNVNTLSGYLGQNINLGNLSDVNLTDPADNDILYFNGTDWENSKFGDVLTIAGPLKLGGNLDADSNSIINLKQPKENEYYNAATVQYVNEKIPSGPGGTVSLLKHLNDVDDNLNPTSNQLFYYNGFKWTSMITSDFANVLGFVPLAGTTGGLVSDTRPNFLDRDALIYYDPGSTASGNLTDSQLRNVVTNESLVSVNMGDILWGTEGESLLKIQYGNFDTSAGVVNLGYKVNMSPTNPIIPNQHIPENPDGVQFDFNVFAAETKAPDPKKTNFENLYYEKVLSRSINEYPFISLGDISEEINGVLGNLLATPYRTILDPAAISAPPDQILDEEYIVNKSNLEVSLDGFKQYASIRNWAIAEIEPTNSSSTVIIGVSNYTIANYNTFTNIIYVPGNETDRFKEVQDFQQTFTVVDSIDNIVGGPFTIDYVTFDRGLQLTKVFTVEPIILTKEASEYNIKIDNVPNTNGKIWGGYPTGLNTGLIYSFKVTTNGSDYYPVIAGSSIIVSNAREGKNISEVVDEINLWSSNNGSEFSAYTEGGSIYFIPSISGSGSYIQISNSVPTALQFTIASIYDNGQQQAFIIEGDHTSTFISNLDFVVVGSVSNDKTYTIADSKYANYDGAGDRTYVFIQGYSIIDIGVFTGNIEVSTESLFDSMEGGQFSDGTTYFYKFTDPITWNNKTDIELNILLDGDYDEVGMTNFPSNAIKWNKDISSNIKMEVIIRHSS